jgi:hypothetical protein
LKRCLPCGGAPVVESAYVGFTVVCGDCYDGPGSEIAHGYTRKEAEQDWDEKQSSDWYGEDAS